MVTFSSCTHVFSGTDGNANLPLGSVNSIAFFTSVPVGKNRDNVQTVAMLMLVAGFSPGSFTGCLKYIMAVQDIRSMSA